ncbi:MAG TPA: NUDIX hydrolase [Anaerolineaceae bacterium]|jgi:8-oxo-dGTP diphosphatase
MSGRKIRFCPYCGASIETRLFFGQERPVCTACGWIHFEDPKVAAAVLVERDGQVLLTQRAGEPFQGLWALPAGFVDAREDPARAAERECLEETGLVVHVTGLLELITGREHENGADLLLLYRAELVGGELQSGDDARDAAFFSRTNLPPLAFRATKKALGVE